MLSSDQAQGSARGTATPSACPHFQPVMETGIHLAARRPGDENKGLVAVASMSLGFPGGSVPCCLPTRMFTAFHTT